MRQFLRDVLVAVAATVLAAVVIRMLNLYNARSPGGTNPFTGASRKSFINSRGLPTTGRQVFTGLAAHLFLEIRARAE